MIAQPNIPQLQRFIGYQFSDDSLLRQALTHRSYGADNNERLEFLGDSILGFTIAEFLYREFPMMPEGILSRQRSRLVKGETLAEIAHDFSLSDYLIMGQGELKSGGFRRCSILADTVEAMIGAIFLDSDLETCKAIILRWFDARLKDICPDDQLKDAKTELQELLQSKKKALPVYTVTQVEGASHEQSFTVSCIVDLLQTEVKATASSRRKAEKKAATIALNLLLDRGF